MRRQCGRRGGGVVVVVVVWTAAYNAAEVEAVGNLVTDHLREREEVGLARNSYNIVIRYENEETYC